MYFGGLDGYFVKDNFRYCIISILYGLYKVKYRILGRFVGTFGKRIVVSICYIDNHNVSMFI